MTLKTIGYQQYLAEIPESGRHILAQQTDEQIVVYQAFNPSIANFAVEHQFFGGNHYSYGRMSWIKPNFLWMMYRCGWAEKENQESVLAIWLLKKDFDTILGEAAHSSFKKEFYPTQEAWKQDLIKRSVRLQWDPDHDIYGNKQERKAIQLGMKGKILEKFGKTMVTKIEDITSFVKEQKAIIEERRLDDLMVPAEWVYQPDDKALVERIGIF
jgi:hypothetical protein